MKRSDLIEIINGFAAEGKVFSNEQDFQFELAQELKNRNDVEEVKLEVLSFKKDELNLRGDNLTERILDDGSLDLSINDANGNKIKAKKEYSDIIIKTNDTYCAIELKFKGADKAYLYKSEKFGDVVVMGHGAADIGSYLFIKDIERLENINQRVFPSGITIAKGFAVLLTNNERYWNPEKKFTGIWQNFGIHEDRLINECKEINEDREINKKLSFVRNQKEIEEYNGYKALELSGKYHFQWEKYNLNSAPPQFSFLVVEVQPQKIN